MEVMERKGLAAPSPAPKGAAALYHVWDWRGRPRSGSCLLVLSCAVALQPCPARCRRAVTLPAASTLPARAGETRRARGAGLA